MNYKKMNIKELKQFERYRERIHEVAQLYDENFINNRLTYTAANGEIVDLISSSSNFMHLCGISYRSAGEFFDDAYRNTLAIEDITIRNDGTTFQKLQTLSNLDLLLKTGISIIGRGIYLKLRFDRAIRTRKQILALSLVSKSDYFVPQSLLNLKSSKRFNTGSKVIKLEATNIYTDQTTLIFEDTP